MTLSTGTAEHSLPAKSAETPKCTVAIPVFNRERLIRRALQSALDQDVPGLEILVVDNCSDDRTWDVLCDYNDPRLRLVQNDHNVGLFGNFNRCLDLAQGKYLRFLCSDDVLTPNCLRSEIEIMERHPKVSLLTTRGRRIDEAGQVLGPQADHFPHGIYAGEEAIQAALWFQTHYALNPFNYPSGVLLRRTAALQAGQFDTTMRMAGDVDFFLRILEQGDLAVADSVGCEITIHNTQEGISAAADGSVLREFTAIVRRYRLLLKKSGTDQHIQAHLAAWALGYAFTYRRRGQSEAASLYWDIASRSSISIWGQAEAVARLIALRLWLRLTGQRRFSMHLLETLSASGGG